MFTKFGMRFSHTHSKSVFLNPIIIFTDGCIIKKQNQYIAGIGIYFPNGDFPNIAHGFRVSLWDPNKIESMAIQYALCETSKSTRPITIFTDSLYCVKAFNCSQHLTIKHVKAHQYTGTPESIGNSIADRLANYGAHMFNVNSTTCPP